MESQFFEEDSGSDRLLTLFGGTFRIAVSLAKLFQAEVLMLHVIDTRA